MLRNPFCSSSRSPGASIPRVFRPQNISVFELTKPGPSPRPIQIDLLKWPPVERSPHETINSSHPMRGGHVQYYNYHLQSNQPFGHLLLCMLTWPSTNVSPPSDICFCLITSPIFHVGVPNATWVSCISHHTVSRFDRHHTCQLPQLSLGVHGRQKRPDGYAYPHRGLILCIHDLHSLAVKAYRARRVCSIHGNTVFLCPCVVRECRIGKRYLGGHNTGRGLAVANAALVLWCFGA